MGNKPTRREAPAILIRSVDVAARAVAKIQDMVEDQTGFRPTATDVVRNAIRLYAEEFGISVE